MQSQSQQLTSFLNMVRGQDFIVLDTETTGLLIGEIVNIAIIDHTGNVLIDEFVKPEMGIPNEATAIHGITNEMVKDAPRWNIIAPKVMDIVRGRDLIVYNATYDRKMMHQSNEHYTSEKIQWKEIARWHCAMEAYAEFYGDWNEYHSSYRWQRLTSAMYQQDLPTSAAHTALGDALMTLALVRKIAGL